MQILRSVAARLPAPAQKLGRAVLEAGREVRRARAVRKLVAEVELEQPACALCGGKDVVRHKTFNGFQIVRCVKDGLMFVSPRPKDVTAFYDSRYYTGDIGGYGDYDGFAAGYAPQWSERLDALQAMLGRKGSLFDVGCATGAFLDLARTDGWTVAGIELSPWAAKEASERRGLAVLQGSLPNAAVPSAHYDVVTLFDCIEHIDDVEAVLRDVARILAPGGRLMLTTGALEHEDPKRESKWYYPPWHLYYFSEETIRALLAKCGFEVESYVEEDEDIPEYGLMKVVARPPTTQP